VNRYGYSLMCEAKGPRQLVDEARRAEEAGFDFVTISDHFHPWLYSQRHSGYAWSILGALAQATERVELVTMMTCCTVRYPPAIVAQKAATVALLSEGRFGRPGWRARAGWGCATPSPGPKPLTSVPGR